jgi:hypothetical protein
LKQQTALAQKHNIPFCVMELWLADFAGRYLGTPGSNTTIRKPLVDKKKYRLMIDEFADILLKKCFHFCKVDKYSWYC